MTMLESQAPAHKLLCEITEGLCLPVQNIQQYTMRSGDAILPNIAFSPDSCYSTAKPQKLSCRSGLSCNPTITSPNLHINIPEGGGPGEQVSSQSWRGRQGDPTTKVQELVYGKLVFDILVLMGMRTTITTTTTHIPNIVN